MTFVYNPVTDQIVVLTMIEHRHANHARIFNRTPHEFVILNAMTVIGNRHDACLRKRAD